MAKVGDIVRREADQIICGYQFDLTSNELTATWCDNPGAGTEHCFAAFRPASTPGPAVQLKQENQV